MSEFDYFFNHMPRLGLETRARPFPLEVVAMSLDRIVEFVKKGYSVKVQRLRKAFEELFGDARDTAVYSRSGIMGIKKWIELESKKGEKVLELLKDLGFKTSDIDKIEIYIEVEEAVEGATEEQEPRLCFFFDGVEANQYVKTSVGLVFARVSIALKRLPPC